MTASLGIRRRVVTRVLLCSAAAALAALGAACEPGAYSSTGSSAASSEPGAPEKDREPAASSLTDWVVHPVVLECERDSPRIRIVSAAPVVTEICCALGLRDQLVGRTSYCDHPPGIEAVPSIGALLEVNVEFLLELEPDLILISGRSQVQADRVRPLGIRVESVPDTSLADIFVAIRRIGELTGRPRSAAKLCENIAADLARVDADNARVASRLVLLLVGTLQDPPWPPTVAGPGSFYDELLRRAGHTNAAPAHGTPFGALGLEAVLQIDPQVIIELDPDGKARPGGEVDALRTWSKVGALQAVTTRRVHVLRGSKYYLPGPRIAAVYRDICAAIAGSDGDADSKRAPPEGRGRADRGSDG